MEDRMSFRTPAQIETFLDQNGHKFDLPVQYMGDEPNSYQRDWDSAAVRMCMFASWPYEQAAGNQSIPMVYKTVNTFREDFLCDRWYLPATPRDMRMLKSAGLPCFGVETKHQLSDFDVIGTSISYPVLTINTIKQLLMSDIPPRWKTRQETPEKYPMVIVGGQAYGAPEGISAAVDCWFAGEVEDEPGNPGLGAVLARVAEWKQANRWQTEREECYKDLAREFNFLYFPRFIDVHYEYQERQAVQDVAFLEGLASPSKQVTGYSANIEGMRLPIVKRHVKNLDAIEPLTNPPLLYVDPGMGSGDMETGRGCPAWCSFCALTYRQKPYRQRTVDYMVKFGKELMRNTGGLHVAPFSPDFPMHTQKKRLISALLKDVTDEVDASSMRVDDFIADTEYILLSAHGGMDQVTLGVEGNSQRMRDLVGKGCSDTDIKEAVARGIRAGIRRFKLYMISDLPGEDRGDIFRILQLAKELADIRDGMGQHTVKIQFSWTPLLIEANTPFQWFAPTQSNRALGDVWEEFRDIKIDFKLGGKAERNKIAYFQLNQRASRDVGEAIIDVVEAMSTDGCWGGVPKSGVKLDGQEMATYEALDYALKKHGFLNGLADCFDERQKHEMFGWEFISQGISTELLWVTYQQMREFLETTDSDSYDGHFDDNYHGSEWIERCDVKCYGKTCGTCDTDDLKIRRDYIAGAQLENTVDLMNVAIIDQRSLTMKARLKVDKDDEYRFVGNDHWRYALRRAANRAELPLTKRRVRFVSDAVKYKEHSSGIDFVEIGLTKNLNKKALREFAERMNEELTGIKILEIFPHPAASDELRDDVDLSLYQMEVDLDQTSALTKLEEWEAADYVPMILKEESRRMGQVREEVNAKEFAPDLWFIRDGHRLLLRMTVRGKASPYDVYQAFSKKNSQIEAKKYPAHRLGAYVEQDASQYDFFRPDCARCDRPIPVDPLDAPFDANFCPKCLDLEEGRIVGSMVQQ
jgi:radical SAM superfamily enzyme YgiQ (UPF0313 family)